MAPHLALTAEDDTDESPVAITNHDDVNYLGFDDKFSVFNWSCLVTVSVTPE